MLEDVLVFAVFVVLTIGVVFVFTSNPLVVACVVKRKQSSVCGDGAAYGRAGSALYVEEVDDEKHSYVLPPGFRFATVSEIANSGLLKHKVNQLPSVFSIEGIKYGQGDDIKTYKDINGSVLASGTFTKTGQVENLKFTRIIKNDGMSFNNESSESPTQDLQSMFGEDLCSIDDSTGGVRMFVVAHKKALEARIGKNSTTDFYGYYMEYASDHSKYVYPALKDFGINKKIVGY